MAQRITVKSVITKPTKKEGTNITTIEDEKGAKMSAFNDTALAQVHAGDVIEVEISIDGKYANITGWKLIESKPQPAQAPASAPQPRQESFKADPEKIASQERISTMELDSKARNTALMQACEYLKETEHRGIPDVLSCADKFYAWLKGEKATINPVEKLMGKESVQPAQQEALASTTERQEGTETVRPAMMPQSIKTGAQLAAYVGKKGIDSAQFVAAVQCTPNDLKSEAQLIAAWNVLAPKMVK